MDAPVRSRPLPTNPDADSLEIECLKEKDVLQAAKLGLPAAGSRLINAHGIEWVIDGYTTARSLVSYSHPDGELDLYPLIVPQNFSDRLNDFVVEINRCTPKALVALDTLPLRFPSRAHPGGHSVDHTSDAGRILLYTDAASVSEAVFAHELAHVWIDLVQGIEDYRVLKDTSDPARYAQVQFAQSFVLDLAVNQVLREKGFDTSAIEEDSRAALSNLACLAGKGFQPSTKREALFMAQAVASELIERGGGTGLLRADDPFLPISRGLADVFKLGEKIAEAVGENLPTSGPAARTAIDELLRLSFDFTNDPLDLDRELLEVSPDIDWSQDKDPAWLPSQSVRGKCEVGVAMARTSASVNSSYDFSYDAIGQISVSFVCDGGSRTDPVRLTHVRRLGPGQPDIADRIMAMNNKARRNVEVVFEQAKQGPQGAPGGPPAGFPPIPGQRSYSSGMARWLTQVRLEEYLDGEHPYAYSANNPTTYIDPTGERPQKAPKPKCQSEYGSCKGTTWDGCHDEDGIPNYPAAGFKAYLNDEIGRLIDRFCRGKNWPGQSGGQSVYHPTTGHFDLITAGTVKCWIWAESQGDAGLLGPAKGNMVPTGLLQIKSANQKTATAAALGCHQDFVPQTDGSCRKISDYNLLNEHDNLELSIWALCNCDYQGIIGWQGWPKMGPRRWGTTSTPNSPFCCCMCGFRSHHRKKQGVPK